MLICTNLWLYIVMPQCSGLYQFESVLRTKLQCLKDIKAKQKFALIKQWLTVQTHTCYQSDLNSVLYDLPTNTDWLQFVFQCKDMAINKTLATILGKCHRLCFCL